MNPQNQKPENSNPDLDFIRNATDPLEVPVKKGLDKKIIVIIVLVVITIGVLVFGMVTGANNKVQKSSSNNTIKVSSEAQTKAKDVVESFFYKVSVQDYDGAYSLFSQSPAITYLEFINKSVPYLNKLDLNSCKFADNNKGLMDDDGNIQRTYTCKNKKQNYEINLQFSLKSDNGGNIELYGYYIVSTS